MEEKCRDPALAKISYGNAVCLLNLRPNDASLGRTTSSMEGSTFPYLIFSVISRGGIYKKIEI